MCILICGLFMEKKNEKQTQFFMLSKSQKREVSVHVNCVVCAAKQCRLIIHGIICENKIVTQYESHAWVPLCVAVYRTTK